MNITSYSHFDIGSFTTLKSEIKAIKLRKQRYQCVDEALIDSLRDLISTFEINDATTPPTWTVMEATPTISYGSIKSSFSDLDTTSSPLLRKTSTNAVNISLYVLVFILAVLGNSLVIITIASSKRMKTLTNIFLLSMAVSDLMIALICIPINLTGRILTEFVFGSFMCQIFPYIIGISVMVSTYTMLAISIERYFAICRPFSALARQSKKHAYTVIVGIWIASAIFMSPYAIASKLSYIPVPYLGKCTQVCRLRFNNELISRTWYTFLLVGLFCVPGIIMAVAYAKVCITLCGGFQFKTKKEENGVNTDDQQTNTLLHKPPQYTTSTLMPPKDQANSGNKRSIDSNSRAVQTQSQSKMNRRAVVMLILIVVFYFILWSPLFFANLWKAYDPKKAKKYLNDSIEIIKLMSYISTCVNPVIYCFMNKKFRDGFIKAFLCCLPTKCAQKVKRQRLGHSHIITETQQTTIVTSSRMSRRPMSPVSRKSSL